MDSIETYKKHKEEKKQEKLKLKKEKQLLKYKEKTQFPLDGKVWKQRKKIKTYKEPTWEKKLFLEIRNERRRVCCICTKKVKEAKTRCFAHMLAKGQRPKYRLVKNNIALVCSIECHNKIDKMIIGKKRYIADQLDMWESFNSIINSLWK